MLVSFVLGAVFALGLVVVLAIAAAGDVES
jgi:hypothetical protein